MATLSSNQLKNAHIYNQVAKVKNMAHQLMITVPLITNKESWIAYPLCETELTCDSRKHRVDLFYPALNWVIEIDEEQHQEEDQRKKDLIKNEDLKKLGFEITRVKTYEKGFIHLDKVEMLLKELKERVKRKENYQAWEPNEFDVDDSLADHKNLVYIFSDGQYEFPKLKLKKELHSNTELMIAVLNKSESWFADPKLKMVSAVYKPTYISDESEPGGYYSWSGNPVNHPVLKSGDTAVSLASGTYHVLDKK